MILAALLALTAPPTVVDWRLRAAAADPTIRAVLGFESDRLPVWVELRRRGPEVWQKLAKAGLRGGVAGHRFIAMISSGYVAPQHLSTLAALPEVLALSTYTPAALHPSLYATNEHLRSRRSANLFTPEHHLFGAGVRVVNIDVGLDFFHPAFFAPGEPVRFVDVDGSGTYTIGDGVDLDGDGVIGDDEGLRVLQARVQDWRAGLIEDSNGERFDSDLDWLYIDRNGNGERDRINVDDDAAINETTPGFGEPIFFVFDRDGDRRLTPRDRLLPLTHSRVAVYRHRGRSYRRGFDLTKAPHEQDFHGTGVWGILAGGPVGHRFAGIAPEVTMLHFHRDAFTLVDAVHFAFAEKADLVLHEYGGWVHSFSDGSSVMERLIGLSQEVGIPHILPAGNLASSRRSAHFELNAEVEKGLTLRLPGRGIEALYGSMIWRGDPELSLFLRAPEAEPVEVPRQQISAVPFGHRRRFIVSEYRRSARGTHKLDWVLWGYRDRLRPLPAGDWGVRVVNPTGAAAEVLLRVADNKTSWTGGAHFRGVDVSHKSASITWPATAAADHGLAVFAFTGRQERAGGPESETTGSLRAYSGQGPLLGGAIVAGVAAPDNPSTAWPASNRQVGHGGYGSFNGTSGAGPHVAGAMALLVAAGRTANEARAALLAAAVMDEQVAAGPEHGWGAGKVRLDHALFGAAIAAIDEDLDLLVADEPGAFALARAPQGGWLRARLRPDRSWLDWRSAFYFFEGAAAPVQIEWISADGQRGRYLQDFLLPPMASTAAQFEVASRGDLVPQSQPNFSVKAPKSALSGAPPSEPAACQQAPVGSIFWLVILGLRRRR